MGNLLDEVRSTSSMAPAAARTTESVEACNIDECDFEQSVSRMVAIKTLRRLESYVTC